MTPLDISVVREEDPMIVLKRQKDLISRMDPGYWNASSLKAEIFLMEAYPDCPTFGSLGFDIAQGDTPRSNLGESRLTEGTIRFLDIANVLRTGIDFITSSFILPKQHERLSRFFTPQAVVEFMFDLVGFDPLWKVMDPACGDGAFLKEALRRGAASVAGVDIDPEAIAAARENLHEFEGRYRLFCQDGLADIACESGFWKEHYDLVIGNPPFASSKWRVRDKEILRHFTLAHSEDERNTLQLPLLGESIRPVKTRLSQVIEVLFLERFVQLARPGGKVAIILPEGVFANSNLRYVREWLVENFTLQAVVGLPRDTFKDTGTTAKTAILYLEKRKPPAVHQVMLAEVGRISLNGQPNPELEMVVTALKERRVR